LRRIIKVIAATMYYETLMIRSIGQFILTASGSNRVAVRVVRHCTYIAWSSGVESSSSISLA
jgi:hypothetical protein